jgi:apolipoprotein N-acyltransferase
MKIEPAPGPAEGPWRWTGPAEGPWRWIEPLLLAALGAAMTPAFVHTVHAWALALLAPAVLVWRLAGLTRDSCGRAALLAWAFGTGWLAAGTWWLFVSMHRYGGLPAPLAASAVLALAAALSLYLSAAGAAWVGLRRGAVAIDMALFAALWLLAELARGLLFTGFPWVALGYAFVDAPLARLAPWIGVYGIGAAAVAIAACAGLTAARVLARRGTGDDRPVALALAVAALGALHPIPQPRFTESTGDIGVALVQTNVRQDEKFALERMPEALGHVAAELLESQAQLVLVPETAVPLLPNQLQDFVPDYWPALERRYPAGGPRVALVGKPLGSFEEGYTNSVVALGAASPYRYDKHHLVPFGEFVPWGFRWFVRTMSIPLGDFGRGRVDAPSLAFAGQRIAPNICYEDLFGEELAVRFRDAAAAPTVLANHSNIAWFGDTVAVRQHLAISRLRSLELERPMLRATNTGATAIVDHRGRVAAMLAPHTRGTLVGFVEGRSGNTPYAGWAGRFGLWPLVLGAFAVVLTLVLAWPRGAEAGP